MHAPRLRRSALFTPGSNMRALERARTLAVDALIIDLEDAVAPDQKALARAQAVEAIRAGGFAAGEVVLRINAPDSPEGLEDVEAALAAAPDALLLPKIEGPEIIERLCALLDQAEAPRGLALWAMIETPRALLALREIAAIGAKRRLAGLVAGANDLSAALGCRPGPERAELLPHLCAIVAAARAHGLAAFDGVYNDFSDLAGFGREAAQARRLGFDGKALIHPDQAAFCHAAFRPSEDELGWARRVVAAFQVPDNVARGAIAVDGRMVERLHLDAARRLLAAAGEAA